MGSEFGVPKTAHARPLPLYNSPRFAATDLGPPAMCDDWMPTIRLALPREQLRQLPRNAAYKYEVVNGQVFLTPRPRHYHALLDLAVAGCAQLTEIQKAALAQ